MHATLLRQRGAMRPHPFLCAGYLPSQLYNFNSHYGSDSELRACIAALKAAGVAPVADCVYNHRCGDKQNEKGEWLQFSCAARERSCPIAGPQTASVALLKKCLDPCRDKHQPDHVATTAWDETAVTSDDPEFDGKGAKDTGDDFHAAPDLDHTSETVQAGLKDLSKCAASLCAALVLRTNLRCKLVPVHANAGRPNPGHPVLEMQSTWLERAS